MRTIGTTILLSVALLVVGSSTVARAQQGPFVPIPAEQIQLQVQSPQSPTVSANYIGTAGVNTFWYWVIANYSGGVSPAGNPSVVSGAANLSTTNTVTLGWNRPQGVQSFTVVRTTGPNLVACTACLLANGITTTSLTDTGGNIGNFTPQNPLTSSSAVITINNRDRSNPFITMSGSPGGTFRQVPLVQGTFVPGQAAVWDANGNLVSQAFPNAALGFGCIFSDPDLDCSGVDATFNSVTANGGGQNLIPVISAVTEGGAGLAGFAVDSDDSKLHYYPNGGADTTVLVAGAAQVVAADVAASLKTHVISWGMSDPATADSHNLQWLAPAGVTITAINCSTDTGTADIELEERVLATPNTAGTAVMGADLQYDNDNAQDLTFANAGIASGALVSLEVAAVASSPTQLRVHVTYTVD